jgi:hypothetical protein
VPTVPLLIFIAGKQGAGKSHVASAWAHSRQAKQIDVDRIQKAGVNGIQDFAEQGASAWDWKLWRNTCSEMRKSCLHSGFKTEYSALMGYRGDLVVEGAILCNDWFFEPMEKVLCEWMPADRDVHHFYLDVSNETILANVRGRAEKNPHRRRELEKFPDVNAVADYHRGFDEAIRASSIRWKRHISSESLEAALRELRGSSKP